MFRHITKIERLEEQLKNQVALTNAIIDSMGVSVNDLGGGVFEVIKPAQQTGDYTDPILWHGGDEVVSGCWYYADDKDLPHEAIKSGIPSGWYDTDFFDFVEETANEL